MKQIARLFLTTLALTTGIAAHAKDSESAAKLQAGGGAATKGEPGGTPLAPRPGTPQASTDNPGQSSASADMPKASSEPPRRLDDAQNSLSDGNLFRLRVCNRSGDSALVAVTRRGEGNRGWRVEGWWRVEPSACENIGSFARGWVYYYADAGDGGSWSGNALQKCVRYPGPFSRLDDVGGGTYDCRRDERLKGFTGWFVESETGTHTWNLNP